MARLEACVKGECGVTTEREATCNGCARGLHSDCAGLARANLALGSFTCGDCFLRDWEVGDEPHATHSEWLLKWAWQHCKGQLTAFAGKTYEGSATMAKHVKEWQQLADTPMDPRTNVVALCLFLRWTAVDRHRSLTSTLRVLQSQMRELSVPNLTSAAPVKITMKELKAGFGDATESDTALPIGHMIEAMKFIMRPRSVSDVVGRMNALRDAVTLLLEYMAGFRIGEAAGGSGQGHGISANNIRIFEEYVELTLDDRKTCAHPITVTVCRKVPSGPLLDIGQLLLDYFEAWNVPFKLEDDGKARPFYQPCYYVCRLDLENYCKDDFVARPSRGYMVNGVDTRCELEQALSEDSSMSVSECAKELTRRCRQRVQNQNIKGRFVNVSGGTWQQADQMRSRLTKIHRASGSPWDVQVAMGPLLRPTHRMHGLHQPIAVGTASKLVKDAMQHADEVETAAGRRPSDVGPGGKAKWASHSARRGGAKRALQTIHLPKVDPLQIDFVMDGMRWPMQRIIPCFTCMRALRNQANVCR